MRYGRSGAGAAAVLAVVMSCVLASGGFAAALLTDRSIQAATAHEAPAIDGILDDACWQDCVTEARFFDIDTKDLPTQATEVRVCFDDDHVYIAFECYEDRMDAISAAVTQRDDGNLFEVDDAVAVLLDTYHDQRSCYAFAVNPVGTRLDLRIADAGQSQELAWDAVWEVATQRYPDRWTAELAIPVGELRFVPGESMVWGAEFLRNETPYRETSRWVHWDGEVLDPSHYGDIRGISCVNHTRGLGVTMSGVGRYDAADIHDYPLEPDDAGWDVHPDAGLDVEWVPTPMLTVSATLNPDFAQIEGDPNQINLSGDELSLEERRPFFSEGMELFQTPLRILYTRRMEDIGYGVKAGGRLGTTNYGALYVRSDDPVRTAGGAVITDEHGEPLPPLQSDYVAVALRQDILGSAALGGYYAAREHDASDYSRVAALTLGGPLLEHGRATAMAAKAFGPSEDGRDEAYWLGYEYSLANLEFDTSFEWIGDDFSPETGFVSEDSRGRVGGYAEVDRDFEIGGAAVDEFVASVYGGKYAGIDGGNDFWYAGTLLASIFQNRLNLAARIQHTHDEVDYPDYPQSTLVTTQLTTNYGAWSGYILAVGFGDYHNSTYYKGDAVACVQPHQRLTLDARVSAVALRDYEDVDWMVERLRSDWLITSKSFLRLIAQGQNVRWGMEGGDYRSQRYDLNVLYGWEFRPGSMFYLAYNQPVERVDGENDALDPVVVAKITYLMSL